MVKYEGLSVNEEIIVYKNKSFHQLINSNYRQQTQFAADL